MAERRKFTAAHDHLKLVIDYYDPEEHHHPLIFLRGSDAGLGALAYYACCLWCLGYPDQAIKRSQEAMRLAQAIAHPFSLADVVCFAGCMFDSIRRDASGLEKNAEDLMQLSTGRNLAGWLATGIRYHGEAMAMLGHFDEGIIQMREGLMAMQSEDVFLNYSGTLAALAEAQAGTGHPEEGLITLEEAFAIMEKTGEYQWEAEIFRLKGEFLMMKGDDTSAEINLRKAIEISRAQRAKSLELRAVMSLSRLLTGLGKKKEAHRALEGVYNRFTEGFATPDLVQAREFLAEITP
jgi:predicted ATPase